MQETHLNFSVAIPTYNRPDDLGRLLESMLGQSILPQEVLIVDDGESPPGLIKKWRHRLETRNLKLVYYKKDHTRERRGLSESKNIALGIAGHEIVFILDDDLMPDPDFFELIMKIWESNRDGHLIGVGGVIRNSRVKPRLERLFNKFFGLTSRYQWDVNEVGFQVWEDHMPKAEKGFYMHGGVSSHQRSLARKLGFAGFSGGRTALEDVEYSLRAKNQGYYFIVEPAAKVLHKESAKSKESEYQIGVKQGCNRKTIFRLNSRITLKNTLWFFWANVGWTLRLFLAGWFPRGLGMARGLLKNSPKNKFRRSSPIGK